MRWRVLLAVLVGALVWPASNGAQTFDQTPRWLGVDVSRLEGKIVWRRVPRAGVRFAFVQASRGAGRDCSVRPRRCGADPYYRRNYARARAQGIRVGAYHRAFVGGAGSPAVIRWDALAEAELFLSRVGTLRRGDLLPALDVESPFANLSPDELRLWVRVWLNRVRHKLGVKPLIYTNASSWEALGDSQDFALAGHRLWVANWDVKAPKVPAANWAGRGWSVWQFTDDGRVAGIPGLPDLNWLQGGLGSISAH